MMKQWCKLGVNLGYCLFVLVLAFSAALFGCSSTRSVKESRESVLEAYQLQKPIVVTSSEKDGRPDWIKNTASESDGNMYFSGGFLNGSDYSLTIRCANAEAVKVAVQGISQYIRSEFSGYVQGANSGDGEVERFVEDGVAVFVNNLHVQGIRQKQVYYEEQFLPRLMRPTYNVWVQLEMSKADYLKAKADVLRKLRDRFSGVGETEAKKKAEELLEQLKSGVRRGV
ncbi:MAG: hypothetical protein JRL30_19565 [Deltaproteobacteria bacterium]|nr:hypothetical protein [Deltaproteobacteria bacterium]